MEEKKLELRDLLRFHWREETDKLIDTDNKHIEKNSKLQSLVTIGLVHVCGEDYWPQDVNQPENNKEVNTTRILHTYFNVEMTYLALYIYSF
jgi:hypothetical protein